MDKLQEENERQRFESWCLQHNIEHHSMKNSDGTVLAYYNIITDNMWKAWKAAVK